MGLVVRAVLQVFYLDLLQTVSSLPVYGEISGSRGGKLENSLNKVFFNTHPVSTLLSMKRQ